MAGVRRDERRRGVFCFRIGGGLKPTFADARAYPEQASESGLERPFHDYGDASALIPETTIVQNSSPTILRPAQDAKDDLVPFSEHLPWLDKTSGESGGWRVSALESQGCYYEDQFVQALILET